MAKVKVNDNNNNNPNGKKRATISDIANAVVESSDKTNEGLKSVVDAITKSSDKTNETLKKITKEVSDLKAKQEKSKTSKGTTSKDQAEKLKADRQAAELQKLADKHNETIANTEKLQAQTRKLEAETIKAGATTEKLRAETKQIAQEIVSTFADRKLSNEERRNKEERAQKQFELDTKEQTEKFNQKIKESDAKIEKLLSDKEISEKETNQKIANLQLAFNVTLDKHRIFLEERTRINEARYKEQPWYSKLFGRRDTKSEEERSKAFRESFMKNTFFDRVDLKDNLFAANQAEVNSNLNWENFKPNYATDEENQLFEERFTQQVSDLISKSTLAAQQFAQAATTQKENNEEVKKKRGRPKKSESSSSAGTKAQEETARVVNEQLDLQKSILNQLSIESKASDNILKQLAFQNAEKYKDREDKRADAQQAFDNELQSKLLKLKENESKAKTSAIESNQASKQKLDKIALDSKVLGYQIALDKYKAWQDDRAYELEKREKADKQSLRESYKESAAYRGVNAVQNAHSGFGTSVLASILTGGAINPAIIRAMKLDKLITAPIEAFGKWLFNRKKTSTTTSSAIKNSKNQPILSKIDTINNTVGTKLDKLIDLNSVGTKEKKKKGILESIGDFFGKLGGIGGLATKGLLGYVLYKVIKKLIPGDIKDKIKEKVNAFFTDSLGLSQGTANGLQQLISDAIPGATIGFIAGGWRGAMLGAGLSIAGFALKRKWDEFNGKLNKDGQTPSMIGPIPLRYAQAAISGAAAGSLLGHPFYGMLIGIAGQGLWDFGEKLGEWTAKGIQWLSEHPLTTIGLSLIGIGNIGNIKKGAVALYNALVGAKEGALHFGKYILEAGSNLGTATWNITKAAAGIAFDFVKSGITKLGNALIGVTSRVTAGIASNVTSVLPMLKSGLLGLSKACTILGAGLLAYDIPQIIEEYISKNNHEKTQKSINAKNKAVEEMSAEEHGHYIQYLQETGQIHDYMDGTVEGKHFWNLDKDFDYDKSLKDFYDAREKNPEIYGEKALIINKILNTVQTPEEVEKIKNEKRNDIIFNDRSEGDAPADTNIMSMSQQSIAGEKVKLYKDVPWNTNLFARNSEIPSQVATNLNAFHEDVITPLQDSVPGKVNITSSYRSSRYNAEVGGARNSNHLRGNAIDLQVDGMHPSQVVRTLQKNNIPFDRALTEDIGGKQWLHLEYYKNSEHPGIVANLDRNGYKVVNAGNGGIQTLPEIYGDEGGIDFADALSDFGITAFADRFQKGLDAMIAGVNKLMYGSAAMGEVDTARNNQTSNAIQSNISPELPKLEKGGEGIMSTEMNNSFSLASLSEIIGGNGEIDQSPLINVLKQAVENQSNNNQPPVTYVNNITTPAKNSNESVLATGDAAKTLIFGA